jgi:hypothetical protein
MLINTLKMMMKSRKERRNTRAMRKDFRRVLSSEICVKIESLIIGNKSKINITCGCEVAEGVSEEILLPALIAQVRQMTNIS